MGKLLSVSAVLLLATFVLGLKSEEYYISDYNTSFVEALATCRRNKMNLASITTLEENNLLQAAVSKIATTNFAVWLDGVYQVDQSFADEWIWIDTGDKFEYTNWYTGQPASLSTNKCLVMGSVGVAYGTWIAEPCTNNYYFACH